MGRHLNVGYEWARIQATYSQIGTMSGMVTQLMQVGVFYATVVKGWLPFWLYLICLAVGLIAAIAFVLRVGIRGYYDFYNKNSAIDEIRSLLVAQQKEIACLTRLIRESGPSKTATRD